MSEYHDPERVKQSAVKDVNVDGNLSIGNITQYISNVPALLLASVAVAALIGGWLVEILPQSEFPDPRSSMTPRTTPPPSSAPSDTPSANSAIRTWKSPDGATQVDLVKAAVTGDLLTVELYYHSTVLPVLMRYSVDAVSYIDETTSQKCKVIQDESGTPMASPLIKIQDFRSGNNIFQVEPRRVGQKTTVVRFRFPAPPEKSKAISIDIPGIPEFGGVRVQR